MKIIKLFSKKAIIYILVLIISQGLVIGSTFIFTDGNYSLHNLYYNVHAPTLSVKKMGLLSTMNLDLFRMITKFKEKVVFNDTLEEKKQEVIYNVMEIDFDSLINNETNDTTKKMHEYFKSLKGTNQNKYTGVFKGKNLIVFVAEAFSTIAIDENLTPTLYKLANEGFRFNNFYTPVFYVSTSDGEYTTLTSLLPKEGVWSMKKSSDIYLPFVYGNLFKKLGYNARAYHNGNYKYYSRHLSHPNMGYIYKGCYNGLKINCRKWPQSDLEMIDSTKNEYINDPHYVTYYMTISGHLQYNFYGNNMAYKNQSYVKSLPYSSAVKAYLATQIELDKALQSLIKSLEENNTLDNTVIALSADHYPYGLTYDNIKERATHMTDKKFDIHENSFILWNSKTEGIDVNKYSSSLDILPTVLNMFGVEYDSRLLMGSDIFSDDEGLVIYNDRSWITDKGKYNAVSKVFTPWDSAEVIENDYIAEINNEVYNKFLMSRLILETNYYKKLGI